MILLAGGARAQDLTVTGLSWIEAEDAPDTLPVIKGIRLDDVPEGMDELNGYAYGIWFGLVTKETHFDATRFATTHPSLNRNLLHLPEKHFEAAKRDGRAVTSEVWAAIIYNPASAKPSGPEAQPRLVQVAPVLQFNAPESARPKVLNETVTVDREGRVSDVAPAAPGADPLEAAARRALQHWRFAPARRGGQPIEARIDVPVLVVPLSAAPRVGQGVEPPQVVHRERPRYPLSQRMAGYEGEVTVDFVVDVEGRVRRAYVAKSNNAAFDEPALTAVSEWTFKPGTRDGRPIAVHLQVPIRFQLEDGGRNPFSVQTSSRIQKELPPELRFDHAPEPVNISPAVYPYEALRAKRHGDVDFAFVIDPRGRAELVKVFASPGDDFTGAVRAMVDEMEFKPALKDGKPTNALLRMRVVFSEVTGDTVSRSASWLMRSIRKADDHDPFPSFGEVDERPQPIARRPPRFPPELMTKYQRGTAVIEFVIDQHGLAQLPRIISATDPGFGYAACQAIASWRFTPARQDGKIVPVRVQIPIEFTLK